jgi:hypothetical protein
MRCYGTWQACNSVSTGPISRTGKGAFTRYVLSSVVGLEAVHKAIKVKHGMAEVMDSLSFDVPIKHAYIITSARENSPKSGTPQPA